MGSRASTRGRGRQGGLLRFLILAHALIHGKTYGYGVLREVSQLSDGAWKPSVGTIYKVISELVSEGLLREVGKERYRGRRVVYYELTDAGYKELRWMADWLLLRISTGMKFLTMLYVSLLQDERRVRGPATALKAFTAIKEAAEEFLRNHSSSAKSKASVKRARRGSKKG